MAITSFFFFFFFFTKNASPVDISLLTRRLTDWYIAEIAHDVVNYNVNTINVFDLRHKNVFQSAENTLQIVKQPTPLATLVLPEVNLKPTDD